MRGEGRGMERERKLGRGFIDGGEVKGGGEGGEREGKVVDGRGGEFGGERRGKGGEEGKAPKQASLSVLLTAHLHAKLELSSCSRSGDIGVTHFWKVGQVTEVTPPRGQNLQIFGTIRRTLPARKI